MKISGWEKRTKNRFLFVMFTKRESLRDLKPKETNWSSSHVSFLSSLFSLRSLSTLSLSLSHSLLLFFFLSSHPCKPLLTFFLCFKANQNSEYSCPLFLCVYVCSCLPLPLSLSTLLSFSPSFSHLFSPPLIFPSSFLLSTFPFQFHVSPISVLPPSFSFSLSLSLGWYSLTPLCVWQDVIFCSLYKIRQERKKLKGRMSKGVGVREEGKIHSFLPSGLFARERGENEDGDTEMERKDGDTEWKRERERDRTRMEWQNVSSC